MFGETALAYDAERRPLTRGEKDLLLRVARLALQAHFEGREALSVPPGISSPRLLARRASFVTLRERRTGRLRGCRGECPARRSLLESVQQMAIAAAVDDPRFPPVSLSELAELSITVSALGPISLIDPEDVEVGRHGLLIVHDLFAGLLLPEVPVSMRWDRSEFLAGVCRKAGLSSSAWREPDTLIYGFETETWSEKEGSGDAPGEGLEAEDACPGGE